MDTNKIKKAKQHLLDTYWGWANLDTFDDFSFEEQEIIKIELQSFLETFVIMSDALGLYTKDMITDYNKFFDEFINQKEEI